MATRKKTGSTTPKAPNTVPNKPDVIYTLAHPNETLVKHIATHSSEIIVSKDEQSVRLELKILKNDWPTLYYSLSTEDGSKLLDFMCLALRFRADNQLHFSGGERLAIDRAIHSGGFETIKKRAEVLIALGEKLKEMVESPDAEKEPAAEPFIPAVNVMPKPAQEADANNHGEPLPPTGQPPQDDRPEPVTGTPVAADQSDTEKETAAAEAEKLQRIKERVRQAKARNQGLFPTPTVKEQPAGQSPQDDRLESVTETSATTIQSDIEKETAAAAEAERRRKQNIWKQNENMFPKPLAREP